jgi:regulator of protease activity HflC (stomatin/prohibitin superfamily)
VEIKALDPAPSIMDAMEKQYRKPDPELLAYQYVQALPQVAQSQGSTVWVIPSEVTTALRTLSSAFGSSHEDPGVGQEPVVPLPGDAKPAAAPPKAA